jgi:methionyl-tRNA synthetase
MKVGKVLEAQKVDGSEKLLKLMIDVGEPTPRQVVSGIAKSYEPESLVGRQFAVVTNLKPAKLFGILSQGMVLAVDRPDGGLELTEFSEALAPGSRIS